MLENVLIILLLIMIFGIRLTIIYFNNWKKSSFTNCTSCSLTKDRVAQGKYICKNCSTVFLVDNQGNSYIPKYYQILIYRLLGLGGIISGGYFILFLDEPRFAFQPSAFETYFPSVMLIIVGASFWISSFFYSIKVRKFKDRPIENAIEF